MTTTLLEVPDFEDLNIKKLKKISSFSPQIWWFSKINFYASQFSDGFFKSLLYVYQVPESITT